VFPKLQRSFGDCGARALSQTLSNPYSWWMSVVRMELKH
jgi:hypothetical protein